jgi:phosphatidylcholine synthase
MGANTTLFTRSQRLAAWLVHIFTASGAVVGLFALYAIHLGNFIGAFWLMGVTLIIDGLDGLLARRFRAKEAAPTVDGELLDNIIDYFNYVIVPAFFLLVADLLPPGWSLVGVSVLVLASAYQFTQPQAKTADHFFKGFPSYWNIVVFYIFFLQLSPWANLFIVLLLSALVFVPIKYVYPSRLEYLTTKRWLRTAVLLGAVLWGLATAGMLFVYPESNPLFAIVSIGYVVFYVALSIYRTFVPLPLDDGSLKPEDTSIPSG